MKEVVLDCVTQEDLGVAVDIGGKQTTQCQAATGKACRVLGCIHCDKRQIKRS